MPASAPARARLLRPPLRGERDYVHVADIVAGIYAAVPAARSALLLRLTAPAACAIEIVPASSGAPPALRCGRFSHGGDAPARYDLLLRPDLPATERSELHVKHPAPGRRPVLLLFCGLAQRFAMPLNLAHRWLARLGAHVVYPRDFKRVYYLAGVGGLGAGYDATCGALRELATSLDASGIVCLGNSAGSFGALNLALDLHATGVLCLSGPTRIDQSLGDVERGFTDAGLAIASVPRDHLDVRRRLVRMPRRPRHVHGADNDVDRAEAANLAGIGGVELLPIDGWSRHSVVEALIPSGAFDAHLRWLVGTTAPA